MPDQNYKINTEYTVEDKATRNLDRISRSLDTVESSTKDADRSFLSMTGHMAVGAAKTTGKITALAGGVYAGTLAVRNGKAAWETFNSTINSSGSGIAAATSAFNIFGATVKNDFNMANNAVDAMKTNLPSLGAKAGQLALDFLPLLDTLFVIGTIFGVASMGAAIGRTIVAPSESLAGAFETEMKRLKLALNTTVPEFQKFKNMTTEMAMTTQYSATEAANALYLIGSATGSSKLTEAFLKPTLYMATASAGALDLNQSWRTLQQTMSAFQLPETFESATRITDVLAKATQTTNFEFNEFQSAIASAGDVLVKFNQPLEETIGFLAAIKKFLPAYAGQSGQVFGMGMRQLGELQNLPKLEAIVNQAGKTIYTNEGKLKSQIQIFESLALALGLTKENFMNLRDPKVLQGKRVLDSLFGGGWAAQGFEMAMKTGFDNIRKMSSDIDKADGTAQKFYETMSKTYEVLKKTAESAKQLFIQNIGAIFIFWESKFLSFEKNFWIRLNKLADAVAPMKAMFASLLFFTTKTVQVMTTLVALTSLALMPRLLDMGKKQLASWLPNILEKQSGIIVKIFGDKLGPKVVKAGTFISKNFLDAFNFVALGKNLLKLGLYAEGFYLMWKYNILGIKTLINSVFGNLEEKFKQIKTAFLTVNTLLKDGKLAISEWLKLTDTQREWVKIILNWALVGRALLKGFFEGLQMVGQAIDGIFRKLFPTKKAMDGFNRSVQWAGIGWMNLLAIMNRFGKFIGVVVSFFVPTMILIKLWKDLSSTVRSVWTEFGNFIKTINSVVESLKKLIFGEKLVEMQSKSNTRAKREEEAQERSLQLARSGTYRQGYSGLYSAGKMNKMLLGGSLLTAGISTAASLGATAYTLNQQGRMNEFGSYASKQTAATVVGGLIGAGLGGLVGALAGGVGAVPGATVGFGIGSSLGSMAGSMMFDPNNTPQMASGGVVPGALGQARPIVAHGGEVIYNPQKSNGGDNFAKLSSSVNVGEIKLIFQPQKLDKEEARTFANYVIEEITYQMNEDRFRSPVHA